VGGLGLGGPTFEGSHYLLAEVFGVGFHSYMISPGSRFLINAVGGSGTRDFLFTC
jgi:hypothetical protein